MSRARQAMALCFLSLLFAAGSINGAANAQPTAPNKPSVAQRDTIEILGISFAFYYTRYSCTDSNYPKSIYAYVYENADIVINRAAKNKKFRALRLTDQERGTLVQLAQRWNVLGYNLGSNLVACDFNAVKGTAEQLVVTAQAVEDFLNGVVKLREIEAKAPTKEKSPAFAENEICKTLVPSSAVGDAVRGFAALPKGPGDLPASAVDRVAEEASGANATTDAGDLTKLNASNCLVSQPDYGLPERVRQKLGAGLTLWGRQ